MRSEHLHKTGTKPITVDYKWNSFARIIDVGGAYGSFLQNLLEVNRKPAGLLFDQAQVPTVPLLLAPLRHAACASMAASRMHAV